jgi:hypothetical protein
VNAPDRGPQELRWEAVDRLLHLALDRPAEERSDFLRDACADAALQAEVEALIAAHDTRGPLDRLSDEVMAPLLTPRELAPPPEAALASQQRYRIIERYRRRRHGRGVPGARRAARSATSRSSSCRPI